MIFLVVKATIICQIVLRSGHLSLSFTFLHIRIVCSSYFYVPLTVHLSVTIANDQLEAQIFLIHLLQFSTCTFFEQYFTHPQEIKFY